MLFLWLADSGRPGPDTPTAGSQHADRVDPVNAALIGTFTGALVPSSNQVDIQTRLRDS